MAESRYGIRLGRPVRASSGPRVTRNVRLDSAVDARVLAFQRQGRFDTYTLALEELIRRGLGVGVDLADGGGDARAVGDK